MKIEIGGAEKLDERVWKAQLTPSEVRLLAPKMERDGDFTVVLLAEDPKGDEDQGHISFEHTKCTIINAGNSDTAIFVVNDIRPKQQNHLTEESTFSSSPGDGKFVHLLPPQLKDLGTFLLCKIRDLFPGDLKLYPSSGKYVETPDNFWTIRPQSRDGSFRVTLRGRPESFSQVGTLELKPDMTGYSSCKVSNKEQALELVMLLKQVRKK
uniref:Uncharacterized protein n=1 Tax=Geobacter sp. (strain M21) TaxID=443144 RepID=C6E224_GEOSM